MPWSLQRRPRVPAPGEQVAVLMLRRLRQDHDVRRARDGEQGMGWRPGGSEGLGRESGGAAARRGKDSMSRMRVYLSAAFSRKLEMRFLAGALRRLGVEVVSTWHDELSDDDDLMAGDAWAKPDKCLREIRSSDTFVAFTPGTPRGGRHAEWGAAAVLAQRLVLVGPPEQHFHRLPGVERIDTKTRLIRLLTVDAREAC